MKVLSRVGVTQEHVRKALDIKSSIESTVCRIHKLNVVSTSDSQKSSTATTSDGKQCCFIVRLQQQVHVYQ